MKQLAIVLSLATVLVSANSSFALNGQVIRGTWAGRMTVVQDTCGFTHEPMPFRHKITASNGTTVQMFLRDQQGILTYATIPYVGDDRNGGYFRAVSMSPLRVSAAVRLTVAHTYLGIRRNRANAESAYIFQDVTTSESCQVIYRGQARKVSNF